MSDQDGDESSGVRQATYLPMAVIFALIMGIVAYLVVGDGKDNVSRQPRVFVPVAADVPAAQTFTKCELDVSSICGRLKAGSFDETKR